MNERSRFRILAFGIFSAFIVAILRLAQTTMLPDERLKTSYARTTNPRGNIYDRRGRLIAGVSSTSSLYARPGRLSPELKEYIKSELYATGVFSSEEISNFDKTNKNFIYIKRDMTPSVLAPVSNLYRLLKKEKYLKNDELGITSEESRFYPYQFLSPIIGTTGRDGTGLYGIEYTLNNQLNEGYQATLSLDAEISRIAYEELVRVVSESQANSGSVAILDLKTREILALVQTGSDPQKPISTSHIYEPGSVMKIFTAAFAMEQGLASTTSPNFDDQTPYKIGDYSFSKPAYGYIPLRTMLKRSANISFARLSSQFGANDYYLWLTELGFGQKPNLPLTSLERGILHPPKNWSALSKPMLAIGQEIGVTTLQLAIAASVIGGEGLYISPIILRSLRNPSGNETLTNYQEPKQLFHPQKSKELIYAIEIDLTNRGTGTHAAVEGIRVGGKTGTGMIAGPAGYGSGKNNTTFIGFLPIEDPKFVIVVAVHNPKGSSRSGGGVSAPLFANITRRIILSTSYK